MIIQTSRFGDVTITEDQLVTFPRGLVGLPDATGFALLSVAPESPFYWMQSLDDKDLAFLVTDPNVFLKDYDVSIREDTQQDLHLADTKDGRLLVICNRVGEWLTGNLMGPLVINTVARLGQQMVLTEKTWSHRQPLVKVGIGQQTLRAAAA